MKRMVLALCCVLWLAVLPAAGESLRVPAALTRVEAEAFYHASSIREIELPEGVERIESLAFAGTSLENVTLPASLNWIADDAFDADVSFHVYAGTYAQTWAEAHARVYTLIGQEPPEGVLWAHDPEDPEGRIVVTGYDGELLPSVLELPGMIDGARVYRIAERAFADCGQLVAVTLPGSLETLEAGAFRRCDALTAVTIADGLTELPDSAFEGCAAMTSVRLPDTLVSVGMSAFEACESLQSVALPASLKSIGESAFYQCATLEAVSFPDGLEMIGASAFRDTALTEAILPDSVTQLGNMAFAGCGRMTRAKLPATLETLTGSDPFYHCDMLNEVSMSVCITDSRNWFKECENISVIHFLKGSTGVMPFVSPGPNRIENTSALTAVDFEEGITHIAANAFDAGNYTGRLAAVGLPASLKSIGEYAFYNQQCLTDIVLPDGLELIGEGAFQDCVSLRRPVIPEGTVCHETAFYNIAGEDEPPEGEEEMP